MVGSFFWLAMLLLTHARYLNLKSKFAENNLTHTINFIINRPEIVVLKAEQTLLHVQRQHSNKFAVKKYFWYRNAVVD
jgi:hypothetical protein